VFCSTIIPTINRATLTRAVCSILEQDFDRDDFEVIVVNDAGEPMPEMEWQRSPRVSVLNTNRRERSVARNTGAAVARGRYLHFLDDDDWLLPGAFSAFWKLAQSNQAAWLYGGYRMVDTSGKLIEDCRPDETGNCFVRFLAGEWLPLQVSLIDTRAFYEIGGFPPLQFLLGGCEDADLARQISLRYELAGTQEILGVIRMGRDASSTNWTNLSEQSRQSRERALNATGAFTRMRASARERKMNPAYWYGRVTNYYLSSVLWNLRWKRPLTSVSRACYALAGVVSAGAHLAKGSYWRGATRPHQSKGWLKV
jgi:glycosyltransferase involved in cell wall biosynthesis